MVEENILNIIREADLVLVGIGDQLSAEKEEKEEILQAYQRLLKILKGKTCFTVTVNTDDLIFEAGFSPYFVLTACGSEKEGNVITDENFDESRYKEQWTFYENWLAATFGKKLCILELGVGLMYPNLIRMPFEKIADINMKSIMIRVHSKAAFVPDSIEEKSICVAVKPAKCLELLEEAMEKNEG